MADTYQHNVKLFHNSAHEELEHGGQEAASGIKNTLKYTRNLILKHGSTVARAEKKKEHSAPGHRANFEMLKGAHDGLVSALACHGHIHPAQAKQQVFHPESLEHDKHVQLTEKVGEAPKDKASRVALKLKRRDAMNAGKDQGILSFISDVGKNPKSSDDAKNHAIQSAVKRADRSQKSDKINFKRKMGLTSYRAKHNLFESEEGVLEEKIGEHPALKAKRVQAKLDNSATANASKDRKTLEAVGSGHLEPAAAKTRAEKSKKSATNNAKRTLKVFDYKRSHRINESSFAEQGTDMMQNVPHTSLNAPHHAKVNLAAQRLHAAHKNLHAATKTLLSAPDKMTRNKAERAFEDAKKFHQTAKREHDEARRITEGLLCESMQVHPAFKQGLQVGKSLGQEKFIPISNRAFMMHKNHQEKADSHKQAMDDLLWTRKGTTPLYDYHSKKNEYHQDKSDKYNAFSQGLHSSVRAIF